jgi:hypothetical protein
MNSEIIQAYLWQEIIIMGFSPSSDKDKKSWLIQYGKSLEDFAEFTVQKLPTVRNRSIEGSLDGASNLNMMLEYSISKSSKFAVRFLYNLNGKFELMWIHDVDDKYFKFPNPLFLTEYNQRKNALKKFKADDIEKVIDGLLCHPVVHQHIESPIDKHEIRIGGGIDNAFLFLFQLRYQLCPLQGKRKAEKDRLINLFQDAIQKKKTIAINQLMAQPSH